VSVDDGDWSTAERQLAHRLVYEAVDVNETRRNCTDTTHLGQVCIYVSLLSHF